MGAEGDTDRERAELEAKWAAEDSAETERFEAEAFELRKEWRGKGQKEGRDFVVVSTSLGNFVLTKPDFLTGKRFADTEKPSVEDITQFVKPCIAFPDRNGLGDFFVRHGGLAHQLCNPLMKLYTAEGGSRRKK